MNDEEEDSSCKACVKYCCELSQKRPQSCELEHGSMTDIELLDRSVIDTSLSTAPVFSTSSSSSSSPSEVGTEKNGKPKKALKTGTTEAAVATTATKSFLSPFTTPESTTEALTTTSNRFPVPLRSTSQPFSQEYNIENIENDIFTSYDDQKSEFDIDIKEFYDNDRHRCHKLNDWSLKSLRKKFALKNTEIHFTRYQRRLAGRLFTVLLILNIITGTVDTLTYLYFKSVPVVSLFTALRLISLGVNVSCLVGCLRAEHRVLKATNPKRRQAAVTSSPHSTSTVSLSASAAGSTKRNCKQHKDSITSKVLQSQFQHHQHRHRHRRLTSSPSTATTTSSSSTASISSNRVTWNATLHQRLVRHWPSMGLCATFVFLSMVLAEFGVPLLQSILTLIADNWSPIADGFGTNADHHPASLSAGSHSTGATSQPILRLRPVFYLIICAQLLLPFQRRRRSSLLCICSIVLLELLCSYTLQHERWLLLASTTGADPTAATASEQYSTNFSSTLVPLYSTANSTVSGVFNSTTVIVSGAFHASRLTSIAHTIQVPGSPLPTEATAATGTLTTETTAAGGGAVTAVTPTTVAIVVIAQTSLDLQALIAEMLFYLIALAVAFYISYLLEIVNRRAFLDHRKCVESKFRLTFEKDEQERLLASCLPKHLMKKVRDDIRSRLTLKLLQATQAAAAAAVAAAAATVSSSHGNHCPEEALTSLNGITNASSVDVNNNNKQTNNTHNNHYGQHSTHHVHRQHHHHHPVQDSISQNYPSHDHADHQHHHHHHHQHQQHKNQRSPSHVKKTLETRKHGSQGSISRPFKELYIDKHENVTILYADIVNSMLLTTALRSPKALVETLNLLFGRFDEAADHNNCLRIKILGDCYYCISGIPEYDPKHAENCIEMALDMIDIIKSFRTETGINLDMRIGVHSGTVLSGLIGLKKWQFDIWSLDAMKAAKMESTGLPGQVHCSSKTLSLVSDVVLKHLNVVENCTTEETTYLIERQTSTSCDGQQLLNHQQKHCYNATPNNVTTELLLSIDELELLKLDETQRHTCRIDIEADNDFGNCHNQPYTDGMDGKTSGVASTLPISSRSSNAHVHALSRRRTIMEVVSSLTTFSNMVRYSNDSIAATIDSMPLNLGKQYYPTPDTEIHPLFLYFLRRPSGHCERRCSEELAQIPCPKPNTMSGFRRKLLDSFRVDWGQEKMFLAQTDHLYPYYLAASLAISFSILVIRYLTLFETFDSTNFWLEYSNLAVYMSSLVAIFGLFCCYFSSVTIKQYSIRQLFWVFICGSLILSTILDIQRCWIAMDLTEAGVENRGCLVKWSRYYTYCCVLALCAISLFIRINLWLKFSLSTTGLIALTLTNRYSKCSVFDHVDAQLRSASNPDGSTVGSALEFSHFQYLFLVYLMFHVLDRQIEYLSRLDFLWSTKLKIERARAKLMREVNQLLLKNILPIHVANRFLANPEQTRELYYETYPSCAVMFAAIPNFFKFYTETPETEHGLQYISLLNDIICEFDKLLLSSHFKHRIEKIKTIGSTYMAASGLHPGRASIDNNVVTVQKETQNLIHLIRFAMSMIKVLGKLNSMTRIREVTEQKKKSANFKLRIGIASGPVIAGVVGALKPQYDIWGDTVNVASRMDTSGVANKIHFPENVARMLLDNTDFMPQTRGIQEIKGKGAIETFLLDYDPHECPD